MAKNRRREEGEAAHIDARLRVHGTVARQIGMEIVSGLLRPGQVLEGEVEASARLQISRTAYREAVRILSAKGLVSSKPRTGTRVMPITDWHLMDPDVLAWMFTGGPRPELIQALFELRTLVEPAAAALAATRRRQGHLLAMREALNTMSEYTLRRPEGRAADKAFHAALLDATANPFLASLTQGVTAAVEALTVYKLRLSRVDRDAVPDHVRVYEAIAARRSEAAREAMERLIRLAVLDMPRAQRPRPPSAYMPYTPGAGFPLGSSSS